MDVYTRTRSLAPPHPNIFVMHVTPLMVVHEIATRIPFHSGRLKTTPGQNPSAHTIQSYAKIAAVILNSRGATEDLWHSIVQHRDEIWRECCN